MPARSAPGETIDVEAELVTVSGTDLVRLPPEASQRLPSRGQVAVRATLQGKAFETVVEPDGRRGHWVRIPDCLRMEAGVGVGDVVTLTLEVAPVWPEPEVPDDLAGALSDAPAHVGEAWDDITSMARWEWVRWVGATRSATTRQKRVEVSISKLGHGSRRPCCFDLSSCTDPEVARGGKLPEA